MVQYKLYIRGGNALCQEIIQLMQTAPPIWHSVEKFDIERIPAARRAQVWPRDVTKVPTLLITDAQRPERRYLEGQVLQWLQAQIAAIRQQNGGQAPPAVPTGPTIPQDMPAPQQNGQQQKQNENHL